MGLPLPPFATPGDAAERVYRVPYSPRASQARAWAAAHGIRPADDGRARTALLLVDVQNTFCLPEFELFVGGRSGRGAIEDNERIVRLSLPQPRPHHADRRDARHPHRGPDLPPRVLGGRGGRAPPAAHRHRARRRRERALAGQPPLAAAVVAPRRASTSQAWALHYVRRLAEGGQYPLVVWPYHSMVGGIGHALVSAVEEAVFFHSIARQSPTRVEVKGTQRPHRELLGAGAEVTEDASGAPIAAAEPGARRAPARASTP